MNTRDRVRILETINRIKSSLTYIEHMNEKETTMIEKYLYEIEKIMNNEGE